MEAARAHPLGSADALSFRRDGEPAPIDAGFHGQDGIRLAAGAAARRLEPLRPAW